MDAHTTAVRLVVGLATAVLLSGCGAGATPSPPPTATASPTTPTPTASPATPTPTAIPTASSASLAPSEDPTAITYGPVTVVTGSEECTIDVGPGTAGPGGVLQFRDGRLTCTPTTNDSRVDGTATATWYMDGWGPNNETGAVVQWGTVHLENAGGAWEGRATGVWSSDRGDIITIWYQGTGGYDGLSYFELLTGGHPWEIKGEIFPGDPPTP